MSSDMFLLLKEILPAKDKPKCYRRKGMMILRDGENERRPWDKMADRKLEARKETFWIF
jgi:hypothetical protein